MERIVLTLFALMLVHIAVVVIRVSYRCYLAQRIQGIDTSTQEFQRSRKRLVAETSLWVGTLKSVAFASPYLGLAGTCLGILDNFSVGYSGSRYFFLRWVASATDSAFLSTAAGLLVAIPAVVTHDYLHIRIEALESEVSKDAVLHIGTHSQFAQKLPLRARFSKIPFPVIAAPLMIFYVAACMTFGFFPVPRGLRVGIAPDHCEYTDGERLITLRITESGKIFLNSEQEDGQNLAVRLAEIYTARVNRTLYFFAEDSVPVQTVANALEMVESASVTLARAGRRRIAVELLTPQTVNRCTEPVSSPVFLGKAATQEKQPDSRYLLQECTPKAVGHSPQRKPLHFRVRNGEKSSGYDPIVAFKILESGKVVHAFVKRSSGIAELDDLALTSIRETQYNKRPGCGIVESEAAVTVDWR